jgi:predicted nucleotidyltransferase
MMNKEKLPDYAPQKLEQVCLELGIRMLILFGSRARHDGRLKPDSDLDLGLLFHTETSFELYGQCFDRLADVFPGYSLDLGFLHQADPLFRYEVFRDGRLLYGDEMDFLEYRAFAFRDYIDSKDLRDLEATLFHRKMLFIQNELNTAQEKTNGPD